MILSKLIERVRFYARVQDVLVSDSDIVDLLNDTMQQFCEDVHGAQADGYLEIAPRFDIDSAMALSFGLDGGAEVDAVLSAADLDGQTMTQVAALLKAAAELAAGGTWTFATAKSNTIGWYFTATVAGATSIHIGAPADLVTYSNPYDSLFGAAAEDQTGATWTGLFPTASTQEVALPSDCLSLQTVWWNGEELLKVDWNRTLDAVVLGTPSTYAIREGVLRFGQVPINQGLCKIDYKSSGVAFSVSSLSTENPVKYSDLALIHGAALAWAITSNDLAKQKAQQGAYFMAVSRYICRIANMDTNTKGREKRIPTFRPTFTVQA